MAPSGTLMGRAASAPVMRPELKSSPAVPTTLDTTLPHFVIDPDHSVELTVRFDGGLR